jgi:hypothetical protein
VDSAAEQQNVSVTSSHSTRSDAAASSAGAASAGAASAGAASAGAAAGAAAWPHAARANTMHNARTSAKNFFMIFLLKFFVLFLFYL